jgi:hypothetical protein
LPEALSFIELEGLLKRYFGEVAVNLRIFRETSAPLERAYAFNFNSFELLIANEQSLSRVMGFLLDPKAPHGQGIAFLKSFFKKVLERVIPGFVSPQDSDLEKARVRLEYLTFGGRRIDLVIDLPGMRIAIENKPWANDGDLQISDYHDFLKLQGKPGWLCYLTPEGRSSESAGEAKAGKDYHCLSYQKDLLLWLGVCLKDCRADRIRHFIEDFEGYIQTHFSTDV